MQFVFFSEFPRAQFLLMVDRKPLVRRSRDSLSLVVTHHNGMIRVCLSFLFLCVNSLIPCVFSCVSDVDVSELKSKLADYGLQVELANSCLVDVLPTSSDGGMPVSCLFIPSVFRPLSVIS